MEFIARRTRAYLGQLGEIPRHRLHEGDSQELSRSDGTSKEIQFKQASAMMETLDADLLRMSMTELLQRLDRVASELAASMAKGLYEGLDEELEGAGQTVSAEGQPLAAAHILGALRKIQIDFANDGSPLWPQFHIGPRLQDRFNAVIEEIKSTPSLWRELEDICRNQYEAYRVREANRTVVG